MWAGVSDRPKTDDHWHPLNRALESQLCFVNLRDWFDWLLIFLHTPSRAHWLRLNFVNGMCTNRRLFPAFHPTRSSFHYSNETEISASRIEHCLWKLSGEVEEKEWGSQVESGELELWDEPPHWVANPQKIFYFQSPEKWNSYIPPAQASPMATHSIRLTFAPVFAPVAMNNFKVHSSVRYFHLAPRSCFYDYQSKAFET